MKAHALHFFSYRRPRSGPEPEGLKGGKSFIKLHNLSYFSTIARKKSTSGQSPPSSW
jgi:hypothetical protein